jgi:hypothetical protein
MNAKQLTCFVTQCVHFRTGGIAAADRVSSKYQVGLFATADAIFSSGSMAKQSQALRSSMAERRQKLQKIGALHQGISYRRVPRSGRDFAARKTAWHIQVASDRKLPRSAYMVALLLPKWLNAKSEEAFPAQSTIASYLNLTTRAVTNALGKLVNNGHLSKHPGKRGYHGTNIYKMEVHETELVNRCSPSASSSEVLVNKYSPALRTNTPKEAEQPFGQTIEETNKRTSSEERGTTENGSNQDSENRERVSKQAVHDILREKFGKSALNEYGFLRKRSE